MKKIFIQIALIMSLLIMTIGVTESIAYGANSNNIAKVTNVKITKKSDRIVFNWKKVKKATGYIIKITKDKKFKKELLKITVSKNKNKYAYKKLKTFKIGKKYYVKVRAYKKINGTIKYGKWSKKKSFTIKKKTDKTTGYWCDEGGTHHSIQNANVIGWYKTEEEAVNAARKYNSENNYKTSHFQVDRCDFCLLYAAQVW